MAIEVFRGAAKNGSAFGVRRSRFWVLGSGSGLRVLVLGALEPERRQCPASAGLCSQRPPRSKPRREMCTRRFRASSCLRAFVAPVRFLAACCVAWRGARQRQKSPSGATGDRSIRKAFLIC